MARLGWRPDLFRQPKCAWCGVQLATCGDLCVACDYQRWQEEQAAKEAEEAKRLTAIDLGNADHYRRQAADSNDPVNVARFTERAEFFKRRASERGGR